jgi:hypothetical protein
LRSGTNLRHLSVAVNLLSSKKNQNKRESEILDQNYKAKEGTKMISRSELELEVLLPIVLGYPLNEHQQRWLKSIDVSTFDHIVKINGPRNCGKTSFALALFVIYGVLNPYQSMMIVSQHNDYHTDLCKTYLERIYKHFSEHIPGFPTGVPYQYRSKKLIELENCSSFVFAAPNNQAAFRGRSLTRLFLDLSVRSIEAIDEEYLRYIVPCVIATQGKMFISLSE